MGNDIDFGKKLDILQQIIDASIIAKTLIFDKGDKLTMSKIDPVIQETIKEYFPKTNKYLGLVESLGHTAELLFPAALDDALEELNQVKRA